ncbi:MAG: asparagine synthase C-terminal domain-containing protein, partial [Nanoarchaeota archaeon]|nr:asparagine synthase C-terminal domain-containing protein [Nanoarchaeota archaeon]
MAQKTPPFVLNKFFKYASSLGEKGIERFGKYLKAKNPADAYLEVYSIFNEKEKKELLINNSNNKLNQKLKKKYYTSNKDLLHQTMLMEVETALVEDLLMKVDKNTMAHAIEARVPFLDHTFVEGVYQIP